MKPWDIIAIILGIWLIIAGGVLAICLLGGFITPADAMEKEGQYDSVDSVTRKWFREQKSPKTGGLCCNEADGEQVEEDIRDGKYWIRSSKTVENAKIWRKQTEWMLVPDDVVIKEPNKFGRPVAWYAFLQGNLQVRCFAPGPLM